MDRKQESTGKSALTLPALACVVIFFASFLLGRYPIRPTVLLRILLNRVGASFPPTWEAAAQAVVLQIRLPRVLAAALIGAALSLSGVSYQGMFGNPLVSPDLLGASSGAGLGAALGILLGLGYGVTSALAFCFGLGAVALACGLGRAARTDRLVTILLSGMVVSGLCTAAISFIKLVADTQQTLPAITYWLMGSLCSVRPRDVALVLIPIVLGAVPLLCLRWRMNLLTLGEEEARSMGLNVRAIRLTVIVCATLLTASSVAVSGMIGWVGLVIPHFARMCFGSDCRRLLPASALMGAAFLMLVDDVARIAATVELPLGILTSFIGAPIFLYLLLTGGRYGN